MERGNITISPNGYVSIELSTDKTVWMNKSEIASLFAVSGAMVETNLKTLLKSNPLYVGRCIREVKEQINGKQCRIELFNFDIIVALSFKIDSYVCAYFREWCVKRIIASTTAKSEIYIQIDPRAVLN